MDINTTININKNALLKIEEASSQLNISKNSLLTLLLKESLKDNQLRASLFKPVKYQDRSDPDNWHCLHISLRCDFYEKALDLRKSRKLSVSFIFALAVSNYLEKIIADLLNKDITDNYTSQYIFISEIYEHNYSFIVYHYLPEEKDLKKYLE